MDNQEIEVKFYVRDLSPIQERLESSGASLVQPRVLETNLRFDTAEKELSRTYRVLRLRYDTEARLTYKGPSENSDGVRIREEIEFTVSDFQKARALFESLGYQISLIYEKFRTMYDLKDVHVVLDEMPYGKFVEIEGPGLDAIRAVNQVLGLQWEASVPSSYTALFDQLKAKKGFSFRDLTFENFSDLDISSEDLAVTPAD